MHSEEHNHCFIHCLGVKTLSGKKGYGTRYFLTFMLLMSLIMINMLLVIIVDASMDVQGSRGYASSPRTPLQKRAMEG